VTAAHLRAFVWLRWRLSVNQFRKAGALNAVIFFVAVGFALAASVGLFGAGTVVGYLVLPGASPLVRLLVWDGVLLAFLFFWLMGLVTELQRSEGLAIDKVLHLPVSPTGAFLIGYLSSLFSPTLLMFVPGMFGLILGQVVAGSAAELLAVPLLAAFVLAVTAVTYQLQGWLAALMINPRRRRTVVVFLTLGFILVFQVPNLLNMTRVWDDKAQKEDVTRQQEQRAKDQINLITKKITQAEYNRSIEEAAARAEEKARLKAELVERTARLVSTILPPGWLALGAADLAGGAVGPALLGTLGLGAIGTLSLWRAYRTTIGLYTGAFTGSGRSAPARAHKPAPTDPNRVRLLEWRLPWVSEPASAVALATFRSLMRAPEAKMALVAPLIMLVMGGGGLVSAKVNLPDAVRPLLALGAGAMVMFLSAAQLVGNQFGYDRTGFRAFVLSPAPRREILLGKNLAVAPMGLGAGLCVLLIVGTIYPMRVDQYFVGAAQLVVGYLLFCLLANGLSILAPIPMAAGSLQPAKVRMVPALLQMASMMLLPLILFPVLLPFGAEALLAELGGVRGVPLALVLSPPLLTGAAFLYRRGLTGEGTWLGNREKTILEVVTGKE
jgi:hypothetical protein